MDIYVAVAAIIATSTLNFICFTEKQEKERKEPKMLSMSIVDLIDAEYRI